MQEKKRKLIRWLQLKRSFEGKCFCCFFIYLSVFICTLIKFYKCFLQTSNALPFSFLFESDCFTSCPRSIVYTILNIRLNLNAHKIDKTNKMAIESGPATWSCSHTIQYPQSILISTSWRSLRHTNFMVEFIKTGLLGFKLTLGNSFFLCLFSIWW